MTLNLYNPRPDIFGTFQMMIKNIREFIAYFFGKTVLTSNIYVNRALNILVDDTNYALVRGISADVWWTDTVIFPYASTIKYDNLRTVKHNWVLSSFVERFLKPLDINVTDIVAYPVSPKLLQYGQSNITPQYDFVTIGRLYVPDRKNLSKTYKVYNELDAKSLIVTNAKFKSTSRVKVMPLYSLSEKGKAEIIKSARFVVLLSSCEGFGMPLLEAMALGKPVVWTGGHGADSFAEGLRIPPKSYVVRKLPTGIMPIYRYDYEEVKEVLNYALGLSKEEYEELSVIARQKAYLVMYKTLMSLTKILNISLDTNMIEKLEVMIWGGQ